MPPYKGKAVFIMYRVYVIDDEIWALKGVISTFPWEEYSFPLPEAALTLRLP